MSEKHEVPPDWASLESDAKLSKAPGPKCRVAIMYDSLEGQPAAIESIRSALANVRLTTTSIYKALYARLPAEDAPGVQSLVRHRRGECACPKETS